MDLLRNGLTFLGAMAASLLPFRHWGRLPSSFPMIPAAFASGLLFFFLGAAIGLPGFYRHTRVLVSASNAAILKLADQQIASGMREGDPKEVRFETGLNALSVFTFLLLTPAGWLTLYLTGSGGFRMLSAWFDDPAGDPVLTGLDHVVRQQRDHRRTRNEVRARTALEGPETADRAVSGAMAGIHGCDMVIVTARRKPGWEPGVVVYTADACYRIGDPVERTIAGNLRTLYPLTQHTDLEAVRKSVQYDLPDRRDR